MRTGTLHPAARLRGLAARGVGGPRGLQDDHRRGLLGPAAARRRPVERQAPVAALVVGEPTQDAGLDRAAPATRGHRGGVACAEADRCHGRRARRFGRAPDRCPALRLTDSRTGEPHRSCRCGPPLKIPAHSHLCCSPLVRVALIVTNVCSIEHPLRPTRPTKTPHLKGFLSRGARI